MPRVAPFALVALLVCSHARAQSSPPPETFSADAAPTSLEPQASSGLDESLRGPCTLFACAAKPLQAQAEPAFWLEPGLLAVSAAEPGTMLQPAGPAPTPRHTGVKAMLKDLVEDVKHLPSKENALWAGFGGGLALAVHPADDDVNEALVGNEFAEAFFKPGAILGEFPVLLGTATTIYIVGRSKDQPKVSHMGMDLIQALAVSEGLTQALKYTTRRLRPDGSSRNSFPSGHAADTFAFATALERHFGWKGAVPAYAFASYVAISRLPANRHWASDVAFGSAVGIIAGRTVTRHGRSFPVTVTAVDGGVAILYTPPGYASGN